MHGDDLVDDSRQLAARTGAFHLKLPRRDVEVVDHLLEDADKNHVHAARVLKLVQPRDHFPCVAGQQYGPE
jgi:hypothetical protein